jgi:hypothetical protein
MHAVVETQILFPMPGIQASLTKSGARSSTHWPKNPTIGDEIRGTGGARKVRFAGRGKGKSGGYRVITFYSGHDIPVFLLNVFAKGDRVDLSQAERNEMRKELSSLAEDYRRGVRLYVERR